MTKCSGPNSLATLYRQSRLASWTNISSNNNSLDVQRARTSSYPRCQTLESTPASFYRRDFGLKQSMPPKYKGRYMTVNSLNNETGILDFSPDSLAYTLKKIRQLPGYVTPLKNGTSTGSSFSAFFTGSSSSSRAGLVDKQQNISNKVIKKRKKFLEWLKSQNESIKTLHSSPEKRQKLLNMYMSLIVRGDDRNSQSFDPITYNGNVKNSNMCMATAGIRYALPGCLFNTPKGAMKNIAVPGRALERNGVKAAVAGVISRSDIAFFIPETGPRVIKGIHPLHIQRMSVLDDGRLHISVRQPRVRPSSQVASRFVKAIHTPKKSAIKGSRNMDALYTNINNTLYS